MNAATPLNFAPHCTAVTSGENLAQSAKVNLNCSAALQPFKRRNFLQALGVNCTVLTSSSRGQHVFESA